MGGKIVRRERKMSWMKGGKRSAVSYQLSAKTRTYQIGSITIDLLE
jgi:hypothetical protein